MTYETTAKGEPAMYRTSNDLRFVKNREALRRAYIDLVKQKGTATITVKELTERARVNRMTFYSHYDTVGDILSEFVDEMTATIIEANTSQNGADVSALFEKATELMQQEIDTSVLFWPVFASRMVAVISSTYSDKMSPTVS